MRKFGKRTENKKLADEMELINIDEWDETHEECVEEQLEEYEEEYEEEEYEEEYEEEEYEEKKTGKSTVVSMDTVGLEPLFMEDELEKEEKPVNAKKKKAGQTRKNRRQSTGQNKIISFIHAIHEVPVTDKIIASVGAVVLVVAMVTGSVYASAQAVKEQVATFSEIGQSLSSIGIAGESGLMALNDISVAAREALREEGEPFDAEAEVAADPEASIEVAMNITSVEKDMKIKIVNKETKKLISDIGFEVTITKPDNKTETWTDDDKDGIIYKKDLTPGKYQAALIKNSELEEYIVSTEPQSVTVKEKIVYQKIDVTDEIKKESQINASKEDTQQQLPETAPAIKDTVEWVESTKTLIEGGSGSGEGGFERVSSKDITDPLTLTSRMRSMRFAMTEQNEVQQTVSETQTSTTQPSAAPPSDTQPSDTQPSDTQPVESTTPSSTSEEAKPSESEKPSESSTPGGSGGEISKPDQTVSSVKVTADKTTLQKGESTSVSIEAILSGGEGAKPSTEFSFSASPSDAVEIQGNGSKVSITAKSVSADTEVTVTGKENKSGKEANVKITVKKENPAITLSLSADPATIQPDQTAVIKASTSDGAGVSWDSLPDGLTQVSASAQEIKVKATKTGEFTVSAKSKTDSKITSSVKLNVTVSNIKLTFSPTSKDVRVGDTLKLSDLLKIENKPSDKKLEWSTNKKEVAEVNADGLVSAKGVGEAVITAKLADVSAAFTVKVIGSDLSVKLDRDKAVWYTENEMTLKAEVTNGSSSDSYEWVTSDSKKIKINPATDGKSAVITGREAGEATVTVKVTNGSRKSEATCKFTIKLNPKKDTTTKLKDNAGNQLYIKNDKGEYVEATFADYYTASKFYKSTGKQEYKYTGWQTIDDKTYYFTKEGKPVTGEQVIQGAKYIFDSDGVLQKSSGTVGIDVSKWNASIDWNAVKNSGVSYVIIRCGYRGSSTGVLVQDPTFKRNIEGATAAGLKVGIYFFSQAVNEVEAVEEASMVLSLIKGYKISYPVFTDLEGSGGRGDTIDKNTRTKVANAFCQTIRNGGYTAGIYANKNWFETKMNTSSLTGYKLWLAQYAAAPTYKLTKYDMWQYTSKGRVSGISGNVDMNISYLGY